MRVVIDTNVIVSALFNDKGIPSKIVSSVYNGVLTLLYDNRILSEYIDVLYREKLKLDKNDLKTIFEFIEKDGIFIPAQSLNTKFNDETDKKFYEVFKSGQAKYLITGNTKHFPKEAGIVTPRAFMDKV